LQHISIEVETSKQVTYCSEDERALQIFFASLSGISVCRGSASTWPVNGLHQSE